MPHLPFVATPLPAFLCSLALYGSSVQGHQTGGVAVHVCFAGYISLTDANSAGTKAVVINPKPALEGVVSALPEVTAA